MTGRCRPRLRLGPPQRVARGMSVLCALARSARSASRCLSTSRPWTRSTWGEGASASTWFAGGGHRGQFRNFASNPIEDSDIFGAGGAQGIDTYTSKGFVIGGVEHQGNVFLYQELSLLWGVEKLEDVTPDALIAAHAIDPPPDLLIVGCGDKIGTLPKATLEFFHDTETTLEVLDTPNAIATYNILVQEGRQVAAALILPTS